MVLELQVDHIHIHIENLDKAVNWMEQIFDLSPSFNKEGIAVFHFQNLKVFFDQDKDIAYTIAIKSDDVDKDFKKYLDKGAIPLQEPSDMDWGVRTAHIKGPGLIRFEIEQAIPV